MKLKTIGAVVLVAAATASTFAWGQTRPQADVKVRSLAARLSASGKFVCTAEVQNDNDEGGGTQLLIALPQGVSELRRLLHMTGPGTCAATAPTSATSQVFVACSLDRISANEVRIVRVVATSPRGDKGCSAFAWSSLQDPHLANNHRHASIR